MLKSLIGYQQALLCKGANSEESMRYFEVHRLSMPWIFLLVVYLACVVGAEVLFGRNATIRIVITVLLAVPSLVGMTHATCTYLFGAFRADFRRRRASQRPT